MRADYLRTQLLVFQPGLTPLTLPNDLESAMAEFIHTEYCPRLIREEYLKSLQGQNLEEEVEPLLPDPEPPNPRDIEQDPYMAGLGAQLTTTDLNNLNCIDEATEELIEEFDDAAAVYNNLVTDESEDWSKDRIELGLTAAQMAEVGNGCM